MFKLQTQQLLHLARASYIGLFIWVGAWHAFLAPSPSISLGFMLSLWLIPLLFPMIGIIKGKPYTYAWASFILLLYVLHAATILVVSTNERWLAAIELILVFSAFIFGMYYARLKSKELNNKATN